MIHNAAYQSHSLFFSPAFMQMRLNGTLGPKHVPMPRGIELGEDGRVTFTFYAPIAQAVAVSGIGGAFSEERRPLSRTEEGYWATTLNDIPPGFHYCRFYVDGTTVPNPQAPFGYGCHEVINFFEVPDPDDTTYLYRDVPHGTLHIEVFRSSTTGREKNIWIYTPPSYGTEPDRNYPVLYLHHGGGENETGWIWQGKIQYIADNLAAENSAEEALIVMSCLYDMDEENPKDFLPGDFDTLLVQDIIPLVERIYKTRRDSDGRAIAGLSMGSYHSAQVACNHPGLFGYLGMLSGSFDNRWYRWCDIRDVLLHSQEFREKTRLFYMSFGTDESRLIPQIEENMDFLRQSGIPCEFYSCPGYHDWTVWRKSIHHLLPLLFQKG